MQRKTWVDSAFGLGRDLAPPQPKGMSDKGYIQLLCVLSERDRKERRRAGWIIALIGIAGTIGLAAMIAIAWTGMH